MKAGSWCVAAFLALVVCVGCGESDPLFDDVQAREVVAGARERFKLLDDFIKRGLEFTKVEGGQGNDWRKRRGSRYWR